MRLKKTGPNAAVYYVFDTGGNVLYEQENRDYLEYVYVLGKHFARIDGNLDNLGDRTKYFYHTDHLGSTVAVTNEEGQTVWASEYTPFGGKHSVNGELEKAAKFTGKDLDEDVGLYYFNARWYDQETGRFVSEDSYRGEINNPRTLNYYSYCWNNPILYIDPTGNIPYVHREYNRETRKHVYSYFSTPRDFDLWTITNGTIFKFGVVGDWIQWVFNKNKAIKTDDFADYRNYASKAMEGLSYLQYSKNLSGLGKLAEKSGTKFFTAWDAADWVSGYFTQNEAKDQLVNEIFGMLDSSTEAGTKLKYFFARGMIDELLNDKKLEYKTNLFGDLVTSSIKFDKIDQESLEYMMILYDAQLVTMELQSKEQYVENWKILFTDQYKLVLDTAIDQQKQTAQNKENITNNSEEKDTKDKK
ncbi:MAG: hypothetical protein GXY86_15720 [Firmicutes bacterium]|nr:hypothetical protein [Bacillota bacterium]